MRIEFSESENLDNIKDVFQYLNNKYKNLLTAKSISYTRGVNVAAEINPDVKVLEIFVDNYEIVKKNYVDADFILPKPKPNQGFWILQNIKKTDKTKFSLIEIE